MDTLAPTPTELIEAEGWEVEVRPLVTGNTKIRSLLIPTRTGGFLFVVNTLHPDYEADGEDFIQWCLWQGVAHLDDFEMPAGAPPRRKASAGWIGDSVWRANEERCDQFAAEKMGGYVPTSVLQERG